MGEANRLYRILRKTPGCFGDDGCVGITVMRGLVGAAAFAGTVSGVFCCDRCGKECYTGGRRPAAGTGRPTVDLSGVDGINEAAIGTGIAREHLLPCSAAVGEGNSGRGRAVGFEICVRRHDGDRNDCVGLHPSIFLPGLGRKHSAEFTEVALEQGGRW
ncbi:MAG TPA: hypothetical protein VN612_17070 [Acidobacteriaceae bacterium]|nr:hypothetical protein [Acidobacteriaceae bacterium]